VESGTENSGDIVPNCRLGNLLHPSFCGTPGIWAHIARVVIPDLPHHTVRRGDRGMDLLLSAKDREAYLKHLGEQRMTASASPTSPGA